MQILSDINIDLQRPAAMKTIYATQGDSGTRGVRIKLFNGGVEWPVPPEVSDIFISFCKSDGRGGTYNTIPEGTNKAWKTNLNTITISLAPQVLTCAGITKVDVKMCNEAGDSLRTFTFSVMVIESAENGIQSTDYWKNPTLKGIQEQIGDTSKLLTNAKENLVSAVNEVNNKATGLSKLVVKSVNGTQPDDTGDVKVLADDLDVEIQEFQFQGSIVDAIKTLYGLCVLKVNYLTPKNGALVLTSDSIPMDDGDYQWGPISVTQAIEQTFGKIPSDSKINSLILALLKSYVKTVNGVAPGEDGNVLLESDNIMMSDGEYGWAGYNVTQALEEVNSSIPHKAVIDGYIDAKIKEIPPSLKDVKIDSVSVVTGEEANIALSGALQFVSRILGITPTTEENITQRVQTRALTLNKLDSAVKAAMCDGTGAAWTEAEQAAARERIGIKSVEGVLF